MRLFFPLPALLGAAVTLTLSSTGALAQEAGANNAAPEGYSITIRGHDNPWSDDNQPLTMDHVSAESLETGQVRSLQELLRDLPNTALRAPSARLAVGAGSAAFARDGNAGINIRGLGGNRVAMSVDGIHMPYSYVSRSAIFGRDQLALDLVKQVDIVRGPGTAALQGFGGMAGSVNFTTWEPADFLLDASGQATRTLGGRLATAWDGDDRGWGLAATVAGQSGPSQWMLTATERRAQALRNRGSNHAQDNSRTAPNPERSRNPGLLGKWVLQPSAAQRHVLALELNRRRSDVDLLSSRGPEGRSGNRVLDEDSRYRSERNRLSWTGDFHPDAAAVDHLRTVVAVQKSRSRRHGESSILDSGGSPVHRVRDNRYQETLWQLGLQADKTLHAGSGSHRLRWGADYMRNRISNLYDGEAPLEPDEFPLKRFPDTTETRAALYLQDEAAYGRWTLRPGLRLDYYDIHVTSQAGYYPPADQPGRSRSGTALSPSLGLMFRATPEWRIYGQYARGFKPPEAGQLNDHFEALAPMIVNGVPMPTRVIIRPNPDLQPERSQNLELGVRGRMQRLSLDATVFAGRYANLITDAEFVEQVGMERRFQAVNVARARIHGFEVKGRYDWGKLGPGRLASSLAYGQARGRNRVNGKPLNSIMPPELALGLKYDTAHWSFFADARHVAAKKSANVDSAASVGDSGVQFATPSATTLDAGLQWRPRPGVRLNLAVRNLTNRKYWLWSDVYGVDASSAVLDAYTRPGRSAHVSLILDF